MARKKYRPWLRDPAWLFPPTTHEGLGEEHLVFFAMDMVSELDIEPIERQFSFRGLAAVAAEWKLVCLAHNIRKAWRFTQIQPA